MDTLFTLPVLSLFLIPTMSSYSTSLNFVFFYMTWATLVLSHPPLRVELFGTLAVRLLVYALPSMLFFLFDILTPSAAVIMKAQGETGLPTGSKRGKIRLKHIKVAGWSLLNLALGIGAQAGSEELRVRAFGMQSALQISIRLPMPWDIAKDLLKGFLARELLTYCIHRYLLHAKKKFRIIAKYHESWYHNLHAPYPLTAHYDHPLVYLLANFVPTYAPAMLFRFHLLTYLIYLAMVSIEETFAYSGYSIMPTKFFLGGIARRIEMHLFEEGEGNFGPWGILDWVCGTKISSDDDEEEDDDDDDDGDRGEEEDGDAADVGRRKSVRIARRREGSTIEKKVKKAVENSKRRRQERHKLQKRKGVDY